MNDTKIKIYYKSEVPKEGPKDEEVKEYLKNFLSPTNLLVLTGAGSSMWDQGGGKSMSGLWDEIVQDKIIFDDNYNFSDFCKKIGHNENNKNLELLLSCAKNTEQYLKNTKNQDLNNLVDTIKKIERKIVKECNFADTEDNKNKIRKIHLNFLHKLTSRKKEDSRLKIFTLNYDRAFEVAGEEGGFIIIDGFSFNSKPKFNSKYFDYDLVDRFCNRIHDKNNYVPSVFHLYKLHGSIDWKCNNNGEIEKDSINIQNDNCVMILPNTNKYELSYELPYFEMINRFQFELKNKESTTLIVIGYSFGDKHINKIIEDAVNQNGSLHLIVVKPTKFKEDILENHEIIKNNMYRIIGIEMNFEKFVDILPSFSDLFVKRNEIEAIISDLLITKEENKIK